VAKNIVKMSVILISIYLTGCSVLQQEPETTRAVGENSVFTVDRQPAFAKTETVDPKTIKDDCAIQADYHFSLGETYSFEGSTQKAIEEFKTTLACDTNSETVRMRLSLEYMKMGLVSEAVKTAEEVIAKNPKHIEAKLLLGGLYSTLKLYDKSIQQYEEVVKLDKASASEARLYLGAIYAEKNDLKEALKYFDLVSKSKNSKYKHLAHYYMARIHVFNNKMDLAEKDFIKCLSAKPDFEDAVLALGSVYEDTHKREKAIKLYASYQEQYGPDVTVAKALSQLYLETEKYDKAYRQYEVIQAAEPQNLSVKIRLALLDIEKKDYPVAIRRLKDILVQAPDSDKVRFYLAAVYEEQNQPTDAIEQFEKLTPDSQFYGESVVHAAYLYRQLGKTDKAISMTENALKNKKDYPQLYALYASLMDEQKKYKEAEKSLAQGADVFPDNEQILFFLGSIQDKMGKRAEMVDTMKKLLKVNQENIQALNYLAYTYAETGIELPDAEKMARKALKMKPNDAYIKDTLGWVLYKEGKYKESVKMLEFAHKTNPEESVIAEHLGDAYYQYQLFNKAKDMYKHAAQVEKNEDNVHKLETKINKIEKMLTDSYKRTPATAE
jgi:tetratricopeptide (TPR) repeat protein